MTKPEWPTVNDLLNSLLNASKLVDGTTLGEKMNRAEEGIYIEDCFHIDSLHYEGYTLEEEKRHQANIGIMNDLRNEILNQGYSLLRNVLTSGCDIVGYGFPNPQSKEREMIPPSVWAFSNIDYEKNAVYDYQKNILYAGLVFSLITSPPPMTPPETGASFPGRRSLIAAVKQEMERRAKCKEMILTLEGEARYLSEWAEVQFPGKQTPTPKTIENALRNLYRELKNTHPSFPRNNRV
ncbi:MAG: hypothetical protein HQL76_13390 [Magnetococcales bacterium]|nr:hypothetical protein [Magnetococcales bacterium]